MFFGEIPESIAAVGAKRLALLRSNLIEEFRAQNDDERAAPICHGVTAKGRKPRFGIQPEIAADPND
jgi:hypothetical protein